MPGNLVAVPRGRLGQEEVIAGSSASDDQGGADAGVRPLPAQPNGDDFAEGMLVQHEDYGVGRVTSLSGYGAMRRIKVRFSAYGEKTFVLDRVKLAIVRNS